VVHFENELGEMRQLALLMVLRWQRPIAVTKSKYEVGNNEEVLKTSREFYELCVAEFGEENEHTIDAGIDYAVSLHNANQGGVARKLLTKLLVSSKRVLGPHHIPPRRLNQSTKKSLKLPPMKIDGHYLLVIWGIKILGKNGAWPLIVSINLGCRFKCRSYFLSACNRYQEKG